MVPEEYVQWIKMIYRDATSHVQTAAGESEDFQIKAGVHQGSVLSPLLFITVVDTIVRNFIRQPPWAVMYADDVILMARSRNELEADVQKWKSELELHGLKINVAKTEYMELGAQTPGTIQIEDAPIKKTTTFKYLGSRICADGTIQEEIAARINAAWLKWKSLTGVMCDRRMPRKLKSQLYRSVIRPTALYGSECWPCTRSGERKVSVMETRMLRWTAGVTMIDHVNDTIRATMKVAPIAKTMQERRL